MNERSLKWFPATSVESVIGLQKLFRDYALNPDSVYYTCPLSHFSDRKSGEPSSVSIDKVQKSLESRGIATDDQWFGHIEGIGEAVFVSSDALKKAGVPLPKWDISSNRSQER